MRYNKKRYNKYFFEFEEEMKVIKSPDIVWLGVHCLAEVPDYFFTVPASSSGKYHPVNDLGKGGLVRHSIAVKRMLEHLLEPNGYYEFTDREKELLIIAALFHDCMKSGTQEEYEKNSQTKFLHPIYAAQLIKNVALDNDFPEEDTKFIMDAISSHMGQWNTSKRNKGITLPLPTTPAQKVLHQADYLASRKDINMSFNVGLFTRIGWFFKRLMK